jgi:hypothetical protein
MHSRDFQISVPGSEKYIVEDHSGPKRDPHVVINSSYGADSLQTGSSPPDSHTSLSLFPENGDCGKNAHCRPAQANLPERDFSGGMEDHSWIARHSGTIANPAYCVYR